MKDFMDELDMELEGVLPSSSLPKTQKEQQNTHKPAPKKNM